MPLFIAFCFFFSGASGLVFELVWTRQLGLVFGATVPAIATVLVVYMGGLALGSYGAGRYADRIRDPLSAYACLEAAIGLCALLVSPILARYPAVNAFVWRTAGGHAALVIAARFLATAGVLLIPTTLMGATLPILARALFPSSGGDVGQRVGALYAANTIGAVAGTFLAGFVLLPGLGVRVTNGCAAGADLSIALLVFLWHRRRSSHPPEFEEPAFAERVFCAGASELQRRVVLGSFVCSGATAMVYQVLWSRALSVVIGSSIYSFVLILLAFLIGLAVGAAAASRWATRTVRPVLWLALLELAIAVLGLGSYCLIDRLPGAFLELLRGGTFSVDGILSAQFLLAALAVLPTTLAMGAATPLVLRIYARGADQVGRDVGIAYAMNTLGAIVGSAGAGFGILPRLGLEFGLKGAAVASALLAASLCWVAEIPSTGRRLGAIGALCAVVVVTLLIPHWDLGHFQAGLFRVSLAKEIVESGKWAVPELLYYRDGIATTVSVEKWGKHLALKNNGKVDASNGDDMPTQIMVGLLPLLMHPTALEQPPRIAVVGYGSGVTVGSAAVFPGAHVEVVELEPEVVAAARFFDSVNHRPERNPRVRINIGDGRNFLTQRDDRYDVIISEPSNPWITGVSNLFTRDYWELAKRRLAPDGVFCQWAQLYELSPANIKSILRTFAEVFPYTYVFSAEDLSSDLILIAAHHPVALDRVRLQRNFSVPVVREELARAEVHSADDLLAYLLLTPEEIPAFTAGAELNTDDNARIEFSAPRDLLAYLRYDPYLARVYGADWPYGHFEDHLTGLGSGSERGRAEAHIAERLIAHGKRHAAGRFVAAAQRHEGGAVAHRSAQLHARLAPVDAAEEPLAKESDPLDVPKVPDRLSAAQSEQFARDYATAENELHQQRWAHALAAFRGWPERYLEQGGADLQLLLGYLLYKTELFDEAVDLLLPLARDPSYPERRPAVLYYLARCYYSQAIYGAGAREMGRFLDLKR